MPGAGWQAGAPLQLLAPSRGQRPARQVLHRHPAALIRLPNLLVPRYTVCDTDFFNPTVARVACRQLGLPHRTALVLSSSVAGGGFGPAVFAFDCEGSEEGLQDCGLLNATYCNHIQDVGVACVGMGPEEVGEFSLILMTGDPMCDMSSWDTASFCLLPGGAAGVWWGGTGGGYVSGWLTGQPWPSGRAGASGGIKQGCGTGMG